MQQFSIHTVTLRLRREVQAMLAESEHGSGEHPWRVVLQRDTGDLFQGETSMLPVAEKWLRGIGIEPVVLPVQIPTERQVRAADAPERELAVAETQEERTRQPLKWCQLTEYQ